MAKNGDTTKKCEACSDKMVLMRKCIRKFIWYCATCGYNRVFSAWTINKELKDADKS